VEDATGQVNWVNPKQVDKKLRTFDITTLDFYPPDYIPALKALQKNYRNKRYTDSLYYSFSGYPYAKEAEVMMINSYDPVGEGIDEEIGNPADYMDSKITDTVKKETIDTLVPEKIIANDTSVRFDHSDGIYFETDPARIKAIWNKKFNNTILATKEFEERLQYMHTLCTSIYLDVYLQNLFRPLYISDEICAAKSSGEVKKKFLGFAARKDGGVQLAEGIQGKLATYFQQKYIAYKEAAQKTRAAYEEEIIRLNRLADKKREKVATDDMQRIDMNFYEEFCTNLTDAYKQIGIKRSCTDTIVPPTGPYYNVIINTPGWKNLDMYVLDATTDRQSMTYTDTATGKKATLVYNDVIIRIAEQQQFDKVLVYLIPDGLSSFQRVMMEEGMFKEKLNGLFRYQAVAVGYKGTQVYYHREPSLPPGNYTFTLEATDEKALRTALSVYTVGKNTALQKELAYQLFEQQEIIRQLQVQKDKTFREQVAGAIFKCWEAKDGPKPIQAATTPLLPK
jgi:hypothetical protein